MLWLERNVIFREYVDFTGNSMTTEPPPPLVFPANSNNGESFVKYIEVLIEYCFQTNIYLHFGKKNDRTIRIPHNFVTFKVINQKKKSCSKDIKDT